MGLTVVAGNGCFGGETDGDCFSDEVDCGSCGGKVNVGGNEVNTGCGGGLMVAAVKLRLMTMDAEMILMEAVVEMRFHNFHRFKIHIEYD